MLINLMNEYKDGSFVYADYTAEDMMLDGYSIKLVEFIVRKYRLI